MAVTAGAGGRGVIDINDSIIEVHGQSSTRTPTPRQRLSDRRLRKGSCGSSRETARRIADNGADPQRISKPLRANSAFSGYPTIGAAVRGGSVNDGLELVLAHFP